jgi:site-specific DNA-methyltransferase (adenine-specific)
METNCEIYNKDCIDFLNELPDESIDVVVTDPAYSGMNNMLKLGKGRIVGKYQNQDNDKWFEEFKDDPDNFQFFLKQCYKKMKKNSHIYIMFDSYSLLTLGPLVREIFNVKNILVWDKVNIGMGHYYRRRHELIIFASKGKKKLNAKNFPDIITTKRIIKNYYPTQKPTEVFEYMIKASANPGDVVCDPFVGSGSSAIAAIKSGCYFLGSDISSRACEMTKKRVDDYQISKLDPLQNQKVRVKEESYYGKEELVNCYLSPESL